MRRPVSPCLIACVGFEESKNRVIEFEVWYKFLGESEGEFELLKGPEIIDLDIDRLMDLSIGSHSLWAKIYICDLESASVAGTTWPIRLLRSEMRFFVKGVHVTIGALVWGLMRMHVWYNHCRKLPQKKRLIMKLLEINGWKMMEISFWDGLFSSIFRGYVSFREYVHRLSELQCMIHHEGFNDWGTFRQGNCLR